MSVRTALSLLALIVLGVCMVATNSRFALLEDEAAIFEAAKQPTSYTVDLFLHGTGQHVHPPLSDLLLHEWMRLFPDSINAARDLSIIFYLASIALICLTTQELAGPQAFSTAAWISALWPFGFHFGRLLGWYAMAFFLVSALTLAYVKLLRSPSRNLLVALWFLSLLALYTNYLCWAIIACLAFDFCYTSRAHLGSAAAKCSAFLGLCALAFLPLWRMLLPLGEAVHDSLSSRAANLAYNFYSLFVSESVAPWFFRLSLPVCLGIIIILIAMILGLHGVGKRLTGYFLFLLIVMAVDGIIGTKRILLISPWLLVPLSAAASRDCSLSRSLVRTSILLIGLIGWFGICSRQYYSALHFLEPWSEVAQFATQSLDQGQDLIASYHPYLFFYLHREFERHPHLRAHLFDASEWLTSNSRPVPHVLFIETPSFPRQADSEAARSRLDSACTLRQDYGVLRDPSYKLKQRFFPESQQREWRIEIFFYDCDK